jgi:hypothetical protein
VLCRLIPFLWVFDLGLRIFFWGFFADYCFKVIMETAVGGRRPPILDLFDSIWDDVLKPFFLVGTAVAAAFAPLAVYVVAWEFFTTGGEVSAASYFMELAILIGPIGAFEEVVIAGSRQVGPAVVVWALRLLPVVYLPMVFLGAAIFRTFEALNPVFVFRSIWRAKAAYALTAVFIFATWFVADSIGSFEPGEALIQVVFVRSIIVVYFLIATSRILGSLYAAKRRRLRWERRV